MAGTIKKKYGILIAISVGIVWCGPLVYAVPVPFHYPDTVEHPETPCPWKDGCEPYHHQHRSAHQVMNWGTIEGRYDGYAVWSNENFNFPEPHDTTSHGSHGFIEENPAPAPDFFFAGDWTFGNGAKAKSLISQAFGVWSAIESDKPNLITGILFSEITIDFLAEIRVYWATAAEFPGLATTIAFFDPYHPHGTGNDTYYDIVFKRDNDWYFDGDNAGFLASGKADDFYTVALHETGHIIGLDHQSDLDDILETMAGSRNSVLAGGAFRMLSVDDLNGERDLYSVPIPEPATLVLLGLGGLALLHRRRKGHTDGRVKIDE